MARIILRRILLKKENIKEFIRFIICGGIATAVDFLVFGIVIYLISPEIYGYSLLKSILADKELITTGSVLWATAAGFSAGLIINYLISVFFVYRYTERAKTFFGVLFFVFLSATGLFLSLLLMKITYEYIGINHWISKVIVTAIIFLYNFFSKRILIFKKTT